MEIIGFIVVGFIVISFLRGALKGGKASLKENGLRHETNFKRNSELLDKRRAGELLIFLDSLEAKKWILFVHYKPEERMYTVVYVGGGERESLDIYIINNSTIKIDGGYFSPSDYNGYLGVLKTTGIGESMNVVLSDLAKRIRGPKSNKPIRRSKN